MREFGLTTARVPQGREENDRSDRVNDDKGSVQRRMGLGGYLTLMSV